MLNIPPDVSHASSLPDTPASTRSHLEQGTATLLDPTTFPSQRLLAARMMVGLFSELSGIGVQRTGPERERHTPVTGGTAISPEAAARCLLDFERTARFLRGIEAGIREARKRFPGERIEILYAGSGPYATLAVPLCMRFSPKEIAFTLLDIHQPSLDAARMLVEKLGLAEFFRGYVRCDAALYQHPGNRRPHMIIAEVMLRALAKEPQVAVTANLAPQLADGGLLIPERISVEFALVDIGREFTFLDKDTDVPPPSFQRERIPLGRLLELSAETIGELMSSAGRDDSGTSSFPPVRMRIPELPPESSYSAVMLTTIDVFGRIGLGDYDSGLTTPDILHDLGILRGGETVEFRYMLGDSPGFISRFL